MNGDTGEGVGDEGEGDCVGEGGPLRRGAKDEDEEVRSGGEGGVDEGGEEGCDGEEGKRY